MNINLRVRAKNKMFWLALIPALIVLAQHVGEPFGFQWDFGLLGNQFKAIVEDVFVLLAILGVVNDPTTYGISDSGQAMGYDEPRK